jgi:hypothetical protein
MANGKRYQKKKAGKKGKNGTRRMDGRISSLRLGSNDPTFGSSLPLSTMALLQLNEVKPTSRTVNAI